MRAASEVLHLTQPAVSAAIVALEMRNGISACSTEGGPRPGAERGRPHLSAGSARVLARAKEARRALDDLTGLVRGEVRIAASQTVATYWLPTRMARFAAQYPGVDLFLFAGNGSQAVQALLIGEADLAFVESAVEEELLEVRRIGGDRPGFYAAPDHPLAGMPIGPAELRGAAWVLREPGSGTRDHLAASLPELGLAMGDLMVRMKSSPAMRRRSKRLLRVGWWRSFPHGRRLPAGGRQDSPARLRPAGPGGFQRRDTSCPAPEPRRGGLPRHEVGAWTGPSA